MRSLALLALCLLALGGCSSEDGPGAASGGGAAGAAPKAPPLVDAPRELVAIRDQADHLLDGGESAYRRRLERLRGHPVVVNKWASWCPPCRDELPLFRREAVRRGAEVGFLGVNTNDNDDNAAEFLERYPVGFPSYRDPAGEIAASFNAVQAFPATAFYSSKGELVYVKQGKYKDHETLVADLERYAR